MQKTIVGLLIAILVVVSGATISLISKETPSEVGYSITDNGYVISKKVLYSDITTSGVDISNVVSGGNLVLENVIVMTDSVGMASGTNFSIVASGNDYGGSSAALTVPVAHLSPSKAADMYSASSSQRLLIEDGSKLQAKCTAANCRGTNSATGYAYITMLFKKADEMARIYE